MSSCQRKSTCISSRRECSYPKLIHPHPLRSCGLCGLCGLCGRASFASLQLISSTSRLNGPLSAFFRRNRATLLGAKGEILFFQYDKGPWLPTIQVLHRCEPFPSLPDRFLLRFLPCCSFSSVLVCCLFLLFVLADPPLTVPARLHLRLRLFLRQIPTCCPSFRSTRVPSSLCCLAPTSCVLVSHPLAVTWTTWRQTHLWCAPLGC